MPKIKLSALATDIKGKAGGSVFARNSGGLYFRDNPSGGGRKTPKWAAARSAFASLAGKWRELTYDQQNAWNAAVNEYNTTNAFGENRVPSGYELFMRLNGPLNKLGLPLLDVPQSPAALPELGNMFLTTIEDFQFTPFKGYAPFGVSGAAQCSDVRDCDRPGEVCVNGQCIFRSEARIISEPFLFAAETGLTYSSLLSVNKSSGDQKRGTFTIPITSALSDSGSYVFLTLVGNFEDGFRFIASFVYIENVATLETELFQISENEPFRITARMFPTAMDQSLVIVNQTAKNVSLHSSVTPDQTTETISLDILPQDDNIQAPMIIQDVRVFTDLVSDTDMAKMAYGYLVDNALIHFDFAQDPKGEFENFGKLPQNFITPGPYQLDVDKTIPSIDWNVQPWLFLISNLTGAENELLVLKTTPPTSSGSRGNRVGYERLGVVDWAGVQGYEFGHDFIEAFGSVINNSTIRVQVQTLNSVTGQMSEAYELDFATNDLGLGPNVVNACSVDEDCSGGGSCIDGMCVTFPESGDGKKKFKPKFKAGAELSKSVN